MSKLKCGKGKLIKARKPEDPSAKCTSKWCLCKWCSSKWWWDSQQEDYKDEYVWVKEEPAAVTKRLQSKTSSLPLKQAKGQGKAKRVKPDKLKAPPAPGPTAKMGKQNAHGPNKEPHDQQKAPRPTCTAKKAGPKALKMVEQDKLKAPGPPTWT